jgi:hypothetical protein
MIDPIHGRHGGAITKSSFRISRWSPSSALCVGVERFEVHVGLGQSRATPATLFASGFDSTDCKGFGLLDHLELNLL